MKILLEVVEILSGKEILEDTIPKAVDVVVKDKEEALQYLPSIIENNFKDIPYKAQLHYCYNEHGKMAEMPCKIEPIEVTQ